MTTCQFCNSNIESDYTFCPYCGVPVDEDVSEKEEVWLKFAAKVAAIAIPNAVEEYGDFNDDQSLEDHTTSDLLKKLADISEHYAVVKEFTEEDILHLAHFPALIYYKEFVD